MSNYFIMHYGAQTVRCHGAVYLTVIIRQCSQAYQDKDTLLH